MFSEASKTDIAQSGNTEVIIDKKIARAIYSFMQLSITNV